VDLHNGLIIIIPGVSRADQKWLFERALSAVAQGSSDIINMLIEVLTDGSVHMRKWTKSEHDMAHVSSPEWA
jgi:hypothetical protein